MAIIEVNTRFGVLDVDQAQVITFPRGMPGFENCTKWKLIHQVDESGKWVSEIVIFLQSLDDGAVSLPLTDPTMFGFNLDLVLSDAEAEELKLEDPSDVIVLTTISVKEGASNPLHPALEDMYVNISAPILINTKAKIGMQKTLVARESKVDFRPLF